jgi:hypothetical protein
MFAIGFSHIPRRQFGFESFDQCRYGVAYSGDAVRSLRGFRPRYLRRCCATWRPRFRNAREIVGRHSRVPTETIARRSVLEHTRAPLRSLLGCHGRARPADWSVDSQRSTAKCVESHTDRSPTATRRSRGKGSHPVPPVRSLETRKPRNGGARPVRTVWEAKTGHARYREHGGDGR